MKHRVKWLFLLVIIEMTAVVPNEKRPENQRVAWRVDHQTLTKAQFAEKWSAIFLHAIQTHCAPNLDCAWEREYGRIESALDFYGADHCSADTRFFPHIFVEGRVCMENGWSIEVGGASWQ